MPEKTKTNTKPQTAARPQAYAALLGCICSGPATGVEERAALYSRFRAAAERLLSAGGGRVAEAAGGEADAGQALAHPAGETIPEDR